MDIGSGIAIAGAWIMVGMLGLSKSVTGVGLLIGAVIALVVTFTLGG